MQLSNPTLFAAADPAVDVRLTPGYYFAAAGLGAFVEELLATCRTVFDIKAAMTLVLDAPDAAGLTAAERGVVEDRADLDGVVIVQAGARIEAGARVSGPVLVCSGAVISRGALVRDHSVIGPGCQVGYGAEITRSLLAGGCFMKHQSFVGDSVLGRGVNVGAFCSTTGLRCTGRSPNRPCRRSPSFSTDSASAPGRPSSARSSGTGWRSRPARSWPPGP